MSAVKKTIVQDILSVGVFLITLEILLRLNGFADVAYQSFQNHQKVSAGHVYTIMCIGDSMTYLGGVDSYPSQLEKILNERAGAPRFKVINQGIPAAPSRVIMNSFDGMLAKYSPDMVTSMMGANDRDPLEVSQAQENLPRYVKFLHSLKTYKLFRGILKKIDDHIHDQLAKTNDRWPLWDPRHWSPKPYEPPPSPFKVVPVKYVKMFYLALEAVNHGRSDLAEDIFTNLLGVPDLEITFQQRVATELYKCYWHENRYKEMMDALRFNFNIWDADVGATDTIRALCDKGLARDEVTGMLTDMVAQKPGSVALNGLLGACYAQYGDNAMAESYFQKVKQLRTQGDIGITKEDYLQLNRILKERKIKGVYIQYPLRDVNDLKRLLKDEEDYDKMIFIDNEGPFKEALKSGKYFDYFTDRHFDDIGHCTPLGNHILASNIADAVLAYLHFNKK